MEVTPSDTLDPEALNDEPSPAPEVSLSATRVRFAPLASSSVTSLIVRLLLARSSRLRGNSLHRNRCDVRKLRSRDFPRFAHIEQQGFGARRVGEPGGEFRSAQVIHAGWRKRKWNGRNRCGTRVSG